MPRTPLTPVKAQANAISQAQDAQDAAKLIADILAGTDSFPADRLDLRAAAVADAAKVLEAAGCYVRRQQAKGLLIPLT